MIRKITIGPDYKNGMNYIVGQSVLGSQTISSIFKDESGWIQVYAEDSEGSSRLWKEFSPTVPVHIENDINY